MELGDERKRNGVHALLGLNEAAAGHVSKCAGGWGCCHGMCGTHSARHVQKLCLSAAAALLQVLRGHLLLARALGETTTRASRRTQEHPQHSKCCAQ